MEWNLNVKICNLVNNNYLDYKTNECIIYYCQLILFLVISHIF